MFRPSDWLFRNKQKESEPDNVLNIRPPITKTAMDWAADWFAWTFLLFLIGIYHGIFILIGMAIGPIWK